MKMQINTIILGLALSLPSITLAAEVNITADIASIQVMHNGKKITIMRRQNQDNRINPVYARTSRKCPPFCIQPIKLASGVKTIAELEMLDYLKKASAGDKSILIIDSRLPALAENGSIPGTVNIPAYNIDHTKTNPYTFRKTMEQQFGARYQQGSWDFSNAKTLVLFCNGPWCGQSPASIKKLLEFGYPASKLIWYRGGMQNWEALGLTTVKTEWTGADWID